MNKLKLKEKVLIVAATFTFAIVNFISGVFTAPVWAKTFEDYSLTDSSNTVTPEGSNSASSTVASGGYEPGKSYYSEIIVGQDVSSFDDLHTVFRTNGNYTIGTAQIMGCSLDSSSVIVGETTITIKGIPSGDINQYISNSLSSLTISGDVLMTYKGLLGTVIDNIFPPGYYIGYELHTTYIADAQCYSTFSMPINQVAVNGNNSSGYTATISWSTSDLAMTYYDAFSKTPFKSVTFKDGTTTLTKTFNISFDGYALPTGVTASPSSITLKEGESASVNASVVPANAIPTELQYSSSDSTVASVDNYGTVTAKKAGTAVITITEPMSKSIATVSVTVESKEILPEGINLSNTSLSLKVGDSAYLKGTIIPENATNKEITWTSSSPSVATVSNTGEVYAKGAGEATVTATTANGKKASCNVTVIGYPTKITLNTDSVIYLEVGKSMTVSYAAYPENTAAYSVDWRSSDSSIATVSNGTIKAVKAGNTQISVSLHENPKVSAQVDVIVSDVKPTNIAIEPTSLDLKVKDTYTLKTTLTPKNAVTKITWKSNNSAIASVSADGVVTALKAGKATITATTSNNISASVYVTVKDADVAATDVKLNTKTLTLTEGESSSLTATIAPENTTNKKLTWESSDSSIATVTNGTVKALKAGKATITVKTANGKSASCTITVKSKNVPVSSVYLNKTSASMKKGETLTLTANISPSNATNKTITWSSSDSSVVSVVNGKITALKAGKATITAKTSNNLTTTCFVSVTQDIEPEAVSLNNTAPTLVEGQTFTLKATVTPDNAVNKNITWSSSDSSIVSVSNGEIKALKAGTAAITAKTFNGKIAVCNVTVKANILPESVKSSKTSIEIEEGKVGYVTAVVYPTTAANKVLTWTSSNPSVATVEHGVVQAIKPGTATLTVSTVNGKTATCKVTVKNTSVNISIPTTFTTYVGSTVDFTPTTTIVPNDKVTVNSITWTSSKPAVGTVSGPKFTAKSVGMTIVTAKYGDKSSSCTIIVKSEEYKTLDKVTGISIPSTIEKEVGYSQQLELKVTPSSIKTSDLNVTWTSSNLSIVYVTNDGKITLKKPGTASVTATLANGKKATCEVTSKEAKQTDYTNVKAILENANKTIFVELGDTITLNYSLSDPSLDKSEVPVEWTIYNSSNTSAFRLNEDNSITAVDIDSCIVALRVKGSKSASRVSLSVSLNEEQENQRRMEFANEVLRLCNEERAKEGLKPLALMDDLNFIAQIRTDEQVEVGDISHTRPDGTKWTSVFNNVNVKKRSWGENLIMNYGSAESVVRGWMSSPGHRANIMRPEFTHMGLGVSFSGSDYSSYIVTQIFISAKS